MTLVLTTDTHYGYSPEGDEANRRMLFEIRERMTDPFILLHTGDMSSHERFQRQDYLVLLRHIFPDTQIGGVLGNHDHWSWTRDYELTVQDLVEENRRFFLEQGIHYLPDSPIEDGGLFIGGFNGWYHDLTVTQELGVPRLTDPDGGRQWLSRTAYSEFERCQREMKAARSRGLKTVLCTHMGFVAAASEGDWKAEETGGYFGANPKWENYLDDVDCLFFGHSHRFFDGKARNQKTRVVNAGSDYGNPCYTVVELERSH